MRNEREEGQDHEHQAPTLVDMAQELVPIQGNVDGVLRQVTVLSYLLTGQHEAAQEAAESAGHIEPIVNVFILRLVESFEENLLVLRVMEKS